MNALVELRGDEARTTSLIVAEKFGKEHYHVMRSAHDLIRKRSDLQSNFGLMVRQVGVGSGVKRASQYYEMDRKGFMLLAMGFTGAKALDWKIAFIDAFDRMEALLADRANDDEELDLPLAAAPEPEALPFIERMKFEPPVVQLGFVREMRLAKGRPGAVRAMVALGWEEEEVDGSLPMLLAHDPSLEPVSRWLNERTERAPGHRMRFQLFWRDWQHWCAQAGEDAGTEKSFSLAAQKLGVGRRRSDVTYFLGLRLKD